MDMLELPLQFSFEEVTEVRAAITNALKNNEDVTTILDQLLKWYPEISEHLANQLILDAKLIQDQY